MAASMRLRLHFDGSICTHISPRKCWFLVNLDNCNVVADLEYLIRKRFDVDRSLRINLYIDDFLLPPMEKIHVVRDNDMLWVQLTEIEDHFQRVNGPITPQSETIAEEEEQDDLLSEEEQEDLAKRSTENGTPQNDPENTPNDQKHKHSKLRNNQNTDDVEEKTQSGRKTSAKKKKKKNKKVDRSSSSQHDPSFSQNGDDDDRQIEHQRSPKRNHKKLKMSDENTTSHTSPSKSLGSRRKYKKSKKHLKETGDAESEKAHRRKESNLSSVNCQSALENPSIEKESDRNMNLPINASLQRVLPVMSQEPNSDSDVPLTAETDNTSCSLTVSESRTVQPWVETRDTSKCSSVKLKVKTLNPVHLSSGHIRFESSSETDSDSSSSEDMNEPKEQNKKETNKSNVEKTLTQFLKETLTAVDKMAIETNMAEKSAASSIPEEEVPENQPSPEEEMLENKGGSTGNSNAKGRRANRGRGRTWDKKSQLNDKESNKSIVVQIGPTKPAPPPKDFTFFPALVGPPRQGDIIAYKILELSESYCPQLSDYKEAKVLSVNTTTGQIEAELCTVGMTTRPLKLGKFDLPWAEDGANMKCADESNAELQVSLQLQDLVEPRLVPSTVM